MLRQLQVDSAVELILCINHWGHTWGCSVLY